MDLESVGTTLYLPHSRTRHFLRCDMGVLWEYSCYIVYLDEIRNNKLEYTSTQCYFCQV